MIDKDFAKERFGISYLRPYQELTITHILESSENKEGGRILCCLPTGSGKSLCFMYPIAFLRKRSILIYPLLSLMNDQCGRFQKAGIPFVLIRGGLSEEERRKRLDKIREHDDIAVITNPETLIQLKKRNELRVLKNAELAVIDEAHTAVTWGESFRTSYLELPGLLNEIRPHSILAFTATMDRRIEDGIISGLFLGRKPYIVRSSIDRENIFYHAVESLSKIQDAKKILREASSRPAVIFCRSRLLAEETAKRLSPFFDSKYYHARLEKEEKEKIEKWFLASNDGVLSSTSAYGMGVDKRNIRTVIHLSLPTSPADFLQESGRGGRDGDRMDSYVLFYKDEETPLSEIFKGKSCIRKSLLEAMGEEREERGCFSCSNCINDNYRRAGEDEILRWIRFHPASKINNAVLALTEKRLFSRTRLEGWNEKEAEKAIRILGEEKKLRIMFQRIFPRLKTVVPFSHT